MQNGNAEFVRETFKRIARNYDFFNDLFTLKIARWWRCVMVREVLKSKPKNALDLATGSGDIAFALMKKDVEVTGLDFCEEMMQAARARGVKNLIHADILNLPLENETFDAVTISFGIRNLTDRMKGLSEMRRVLKSGGRLFILEFSQPMALIRPFYFLYLKKVMPSLAKIFGGESEAYRYLASSIETFPNQKEFADILKQAGFQDVHVTNMTFGSVALHVALK